MPTTGARPMRPPSTPPSSSSSSLINTMMIMLLLFSSSSFVNVVLVGAQEEGASESLLKFKSSLANADPTLADWDSSKSTPCSGNQGNWVGVLCFNGYVWGLQLENMGLKGQIDVNSLTSLRFLRTLSFMNNGFEGMMPDWRKLGALKSLYLSSNQFSGQIPEDAFKGMTSLKKVHLANNKFTGPIPTSLESPKLIELRLENNQFTGPIPALISSDNLKVLNVSNNQLDGPIPADLSNMDPSSFSGIYIYMLHFAFCMWLRCCGRYKLWDVSVGDPIICVSFFSMDTHKYITVVDGHLICRQQRIVWETSGIGMQPANSTTGFGAVSCSSSG